MTIHKEGHGILLKIGLLVAVIIFAGFKMYPELRILHGALIISGACFFFFILQFFRSPKRTTVYNDNHIIAPADGTIVVIEETDEPEFLHDRRKQVSIFMSPLNVHSNRSPVNGFIKYMKYHEGLYLLAAHPKSSTENERNTVVFENTNGIQVLVRQIAGAMARKIRWYVKEGEEMKQGEEFGFIRFGSRVDLFLPLDAEIKVGLDDKTVGGETVLAVLKS